MSTATKPIRVWTSRILERLNNVTFNSIRTKEAVINAIRKNPAIYVQNADQAASGTTTTLQASTYMSHPVEAGRRYAVKVYARATNGTGANGLKLGVNISGTQTSASAYGEARSVDITNAATTQVWADFALSSGAMTLSDANAATYVAMFDFILVPQNDGTLDVRFAENSGGNGTAVLKAYSRMEVREIE